VWREVFNERVTKTEMSAERASEEEKQRHTFRDQRVHIGELLVFGVFRIRGADEVFEQ
jgi:hypothetical protein